MCCIDVLSFLVAVLGILVTMLIGWQIFNYIEIEKKINKKVEDKIGKAKTDLKNDIEIQKRNILGYVYYDVSQITLQELKYEHTMILLVKSLFFSFEFNTKENIDRCFSDLDYVMSLMKSNHYKINIEPQWVDSCIEMISGIKDDRKKGIFNFLINLKQNPS